MTIFQRYTRLLIAVLLPAFALVAVVATPAHAALFDGSIEQACEGANLSDSNNECNDANGADPLQERIQTIINILTIIIGIVAVILIIINGLRFITAGGDSNAISAARNGLLYAIVGLIIVALAQAIVRFVLSRV